MKRYLVNIPYRTCADRFNKAKICVSVRDGVVYVQIHAARRSVVRVDLEARLATHIHTATGLTCAT